jgi:hypothetical protein
MSPEPIPDLPTSVTIPDGVAWQKFADEVVLVDINAGEYHNLNDVGGRMWQALEESDDVAGAYARLSEMYDVDGDILRNDLAVFIHDLVAKGLLTAG